MHISFRKMNTVKVKINFGEMPPPWDRRVIFIANILALFYGNESETQVLHKEIGALESYGSRLVPLLNLIFKGHMNMLVLEREPDPTLIGYFRDELKLILPEIKVLTHKDYVSLGKEKKDFSDDLQTFVQALRDNNNEWIDGYVTDQVLECLADMTDKKTLCSREGSRRGNNKHLISEHMHSEGFSVFDTLMADDLDQVQNALKELKAKGYERAVVKAQIGASGIGMHKVDLAVGVNHLPDYIFYEGPCLVQGWLDEALNGVNYIGSPSVQMFLHDDTVYLYDLTEQFLSQESIHEGNIAPPRYLKSKDKIVEEILNQAESAGGWLHHQGYRGTASSDFQVIQRNGSPEVRLCEINARVTGATYPSILSRHFMPKGAWLMRNIRFTPSVKDTVLMNALDSSGMLYRPGDKQGVLPINFNFNQKGDIIKGQFLFLGDTTDIVCRILETLSQLQSIQGSFDRD